MKQGKRWWLLWAALVLPAGAAQAAASQDDIQREALLRAHNSNEFEARYKALKDGRNTASAPAGQALASGLGALAANAQRRMDEANNRDDRVWALLEAGLDVPLNTQGDLDHLRGLLDANVDPDNYNIAARRRLVEFALHQRRHADRYFPAPDPARAAAVLRRNAYSDSDFYPWAALTLAKLYLTGRGVPRDEAEALRLVTLCTAVPTPNFAVKTGIAGDEVACLLLKARMHRAGWGDTPDEAAAVMAETEAERRYAQATGQRLKAAALASMFR